MEYFVKTRSLNQTKTNNNFTCFWDDTVINTMHKVSGHYTCHYTTIKLITTLGTLIYNVLSYNYLHVHKAKKITEVRKSVILLQPNNYQNSDNMRLVYPYLNQELGQ